MRISDAPQEELGPASRPSCWHLAPFRRLAELSPAFSSNSVRPPSLLSQSFLACLPQGDFPKEWIKSHYSWPTPFPFRLWVLNHSWGAEPVSVLLSQVAGSLLIFCTGLVDLGLAPVIICHTGHSTSYRRLLFHLRHHTESKPSAFSGQATPGPALHLGLWSASPAPPGAKGLPLLSTQVSESLALAPETCMRTLHPLHNLDTPLQLAACQLWAQTDRLVTLITWIENCFLWLARGDFLSFFFIRSSMY